MLHSSEERYYGFLCEGVHGPGADIDTLCVAPKMVTLQDFFGSLYNMLKDDARVKDLHVIISIS